MCVVNEGGERELIKKISAIAIAYNYTDYTEKNDENFIEIKSIYYIYCYFSIMQLYSNIHVLP